MLRLIRKLFAGSPPPPANPISDQEFAQYEAERQKKREELRVADERRQFERAQKKAERVKTTQKRNEARLAAAVEKHLDALYFKKKSLNFRDDYGKFQRGKWLEELEYFHDKILPRKERFIPRDELVAMLGRVVSKHRPKLALEFKETDPLAFERHVQKLLSSEGWSAHLTKGSGDQGVDLVAKKSALSLAIQCKLYSGPVGTAAVQEIVAGRVFYGCDHGWVVTNAGFTPGAKALAAKTAVSLLHYNKRNKDSYIEFKGILKGYDAVIPRAEGFALLKNAEAIYDAVWGCTYRLNKWAINTLVSVRARDVKITTWDDFVKCQPSSDERSHARREFIAATRAPSMMTKVDTEKPQNTCLPGQRTLGRDTVDQHDNAA